MRVSHSPFAQASMYLSSRQFALHMTYFRVDAHMDVSLIFATFLFVKAPKGLIWKKIHRIFHMLR
jgi:hypothetical protein